MESTRDIKGRIKSVTNIQQITKAMKMVAAARLRKAEEKAHGARPYADKVEELLRRASSAAPGYSNPLLAERETKVTGYLIICGDKGLAGAYNSNVMKQTLAEIAGKDPESYRLYVCGKQARNYLKFRGYRMDSYHFGFSDKPSADDSIALAKEVIGLFNKGEIDEVKIIYTKFYTALRQQVAVARLLPIEAPEAEEAAEETTTADGIKVTKGEIPYIFMPNASAVLDNLLPEYVQVQIYSAMLQSAASELGSRMAAMSAATDNATERIADLNLSYNKARQAQVTNEISEIVGGANALE
jgi:ATP synthase F1, gamma subunit